MVEATAVATAVVMAAAVAAVVMMMMMTMESPVLVREQVKLHQLEVPIECTA